MEANNRNVIILALLIVGVAFFYANLGSNTGAYRVYPSPTADAGLLFRANEVNCNFDGTRCNEKDEVIACSDGKIVVLKACKDNMATSCVQKMQDLNRRMWTAECRLDIVRGSLEYTN